MHKTYAPDVLLIFPFSIDGTGYLALFDNDEEVEDLRKRGFVGDHEIRPVDAAHQDAKPYNPQGWFIHTISQAHLGGPFSKGTTEVWSLVPAAVLDDMVATEQLMLHFAEETNLQSVGLWMTASQQRLARHYGRLIIETPNAAHADPEHIGEWKIGEITYYEPLSKYEAIALELVKPASASYAETYFAGQPGLIEHAKRVAERRRGA